jgi:hypothetical protein
MALQTMEVDLDEIPEDLYAIGVMDGRGHTTHVWKRRDTAEVEEARQLFDILKGRGYRAFHMKKSGRQGAMMETFDPDARRMLFLPPFQGG